MLSWGDNAVSHYYSTALNVVFRVKLYVMEVIRFVVSVLTLRVCIFLLHGDSRTHDDMYDT